MVFAETKRLILREIVPSDKEGIFELDSDPEVHRYLGKTPIKTIEQAEQAISFIRGQYETLGIGRWAVIEKRSGDFIGWAGLKFRTDELFGRKDFYDLGYRFMKKHWGKGYATESAIASANYGFDTMKLDLITGMAETANLASCKVLEKTGLLYKGNLIYEEEPHNWYELRADERWKNAE